MHEEVAEQAQLAFDRAFIHATMRGLPSKGAIEHGKKASEEFLARFNPSEDEDKAEYAKALGRSLAIRDELNHVYIVEYERFLDSDPSHRRLEVRGDRLAHAYASAKQIAFQKIIAGLGKNQPIPSWESFVRDGIVG